MAKADVLEGGAFHPTNLRIVVKKPDDHALGQEQVVRYLENVRSCLKGMDTERQQDYARSYASHYKGHVKLLLAIAYSLEEENAPFAAMMKNLALNKA